MPDPNESATTPVAEPVASTEFIAVNFISCDAEYRERFEILFKSRAHAIDRAPGFRHMKVLAPTQEGGDYLVVSHWESQAAFDHWRTSPEFAEGHRRGFADVAKAKAEGRKPPMTSSMKTYTVLCE
jgi:heme oxygenase (mycobilin-producing)